MILTINNKITNSKKQDSIDELLKAKDIIQYRFIIHWKRKTGINIEIEDEDSEDFLEVITRKGFEFNIDLLENDKIADKLKEAGLI